jgi:hypothetical protein
MRIIVAASGTRQGDAMTPAAPACRRPVGKLMTSSGRLVSTNPVWHADATTSRAVNDVERSPEC